MNPAPVHIGSCKIDFPVGLSPMAGYTDRALRTLCMEYGCGLTFTEVVNARAIVHGSRRTLHLLETGAQEHPVAAHIYGADPAGMAEAARHIEGLGRFDFIDVNAGCPVRKIVAKGAGAALVNKPARLAEIVAAIREAVSLPVTVKTRTGPEPGRPTIHVLARAVEEAGASAIFIHARDVASRHSGPADWDTLARVKQDRGIPVFGNGGVDCAADVEAMLAATGVDGVLIGRAAVGSPWLFRDVRRLAAGQPAAGCTPLERRAVILEHLRRLAELKSIETRYRRRPKLTPEQGAALHFRAHLHQYLRGLPGWSSVRQGLNTVADPAHVIAAVDAVLPVDGQPSESSDLPANGGDG